MASPQGNNVVERLGRYQIRELVGEGAMATVYKAYDPEINRTIAVKLLKSQLREDNEYHARFLREAKGAGVLSHPNIVTVYDVGEDHNHPYIAMELVDGPTLADYLRERKTLGTGEIVQIGIELTRALDYAHRKGIVHRDVKPGNIMLSGDRHTVKVADFGICRIDDSDATQQTQIGNVLGTPHYMSPEQVLGQKVDARSDLFSAGVVLYQLLTGTLPFEGDTLISVAYKITKAEAAPIDKVRPDLPHSLRRVIERALRKQPDKRFQSGEEFAKALEGIAAELAEDGKNKDGRGRTMSLGVRWAITMAALVAITMTVTALVLYKQQYGAMMDQVKDYGGSLAKFMASQNAVPLLSEDWAAIEVFVQETASGQDFDRLLVIDHDGVIRGSKDPAQLGAKFTLQGASPLSSADPNVQVNRLQRTNGPDVLDFAAPILFQNKNIGVVHLSLMEAPLTRVANLMLVLLAALTLVTTAAVALGAYLMARRLSGVVRVMKASLVELGTGHYDYRIAETRNDEFGDLFTTFDATAAALEVRHDPHAAKPLEAPAAAP
ncbi:MAG: protein kinase [Casimicrobiaceae bacterium]